MRRIILVGLAFLIMISQTLIASANVSAFSIREFNAGSPDVLPQNDSGVHRRRRRRVRGDWGRRKHSGIRHEYAESGRSVGHGSRRFGKHMKHGRPLHAGAAFGRGMGGFGKHFGKGTAKVGKRIAKH
ncbi:MAG: hypothetical protein ABJB61_06875 [bacterium]